MSLNLKPLLVAKISEAVSLEIGTDFQDKDGNQIISLQLAQYLEEDDFEIVPADYDELQKGTLPVFPSNPLIRPKQK